MPKHLKCFRKKKKVTGSSWRDELHIITQSKQVRFMFIFQIKGITFQSRQLKTQLLTVTHQCDKKPLSLHLGVHRASVITMKCVASRLRNLKTFVVWRESSEAGSELCCQLCFVQAPLYQGWPGTLKHIILLLFTCQIQQFTALFIYFYWWLFGMAVTERELVHMRNTPGRFPRTFVFLFSF